ncbi:MAG: MMPL family transporter [Bacteroidota bacterium]
MITQIVRFVLQHRLLISIILIVITTFSFYQLRLLETYNDTDIWFNKTDQEYVDYQDFINEFGSDESIVLLYKSDSIFFNNGLALNRSITSRLSKFEGVSSVISLSTIKKIVRNPFGYSTRSILPQLSVNPEKLRKDITGNLMCLNNVINKKGDITATVIYLDSLKKRQKVLSEIDEVQKLLVEKGIESITIGTVPIRSALNKVSKKEAGKFLLLAIGIIGAFIYLLYRSFRLVLIPIIIAIITVSWTLGLMALLSIKLNLVLSILPLILLVITLAFSIHFITDILRNITEGASNQERVQLSFNSIFVKCFLSGLTTAIAFLSFTFSDIGPIENFGIFTAIGILFSFIITFTALPIYFYYHYPQRGHRQKLWDSLYIRLLSFITDNKRKIVISSIIILIISIVGIFRLEINTDQSEYFKETNFLRKQITTAEQWFGSIYPLDVVINLPSSIYDSSEQYLSKLAAFESKVESIPILSSSFSLTSLVNSYRESLDNRYDKNQIIQLMKSSKIRDKHNYISSNGKSIRLVVKTEWLGDQESGQLIRNINAIADEVFINDGISVQVTGQAALLSSLSNRLVRSQIFSIGLCFGFIFIVFIVIFQQKNISLLALIPNILPVIISLGLMGWLGVQLDVVMALLASVTLGIAVDDSIHFLKSFQQYNTGTDSDIKSSILKSYHKSGNAIITTTFLLALGFIVMIFSEYIPIINLGIFITLSVTLALIFDLILLPAILLLLLKDNTSRQKPI